MKSQVFLLAFREQDGLIFPRDPNLHLLVCKWAEKELARVPDFTELNKVWVFCTVNDEGKPLAVEGILGGVPKFDFPLFRFTSSRAAKSLIDRADAYLHDLGYRDAEVFVHVAKNESEEQRCPQWQDWLKAVGATDAERYKLKVW
jgi:hypothetical protein